MLLFYIRHGEPIYDPDSLTPFGHRQAEAVAKRLALYGIDEIYASSSNRAQQTAKPTAELTHKSIQTLDWCNENYAGQEFFARNEKGEWRWLYQDEKSRKMFASQEVLSLGHKWYEHPAFSAPHYKSGVDRVRREAYAFLKSLGYEHDEKECFYHAIMPNEKRVALFAHEGFGMAFLSTVLDIPYLLFCTRFGLTHSGMSVIRFSGEKEVVPCMLQLSNDSHLYKEGLPTRYNGDISFQKSGAMSFIKRFANNVKENLLRLK